MTEDEYLDELDRRAAAYIEALSSSHEGNPFHTRESFSNMADVFTVRKLIASKRQLDAILASHPELSAG